MFARLRGEIVLPPDTTTQAPAAEQPSVRPSDVRVQVLNGTGITGAAGDADQALSNLGYVSGGVANYGGGKLARSEIHYRPGDEAKAKLLAGQVADATLIADPEMGSWRGVLETLRGTAVAGKALVVQIEIPGNGLGRAQLTPAGENGEKAVSNIVGLEPQFF